MRIACFNPELQDLEGCSPTDDIALEQLEGLRKKRHAEEVSTELRNEESCMDNSLKVILNLWGGEGLTIRTE